MLMFRSRESKHMRNIKFASDQIYHIYNRGVEKRSIFTADEDYLRFIHNLFEFNDTRPAVPSNIKFSSRYPGKTIKSAIISQCLDSRLLNIAQRKRLIDIFAFCLMPNHFHLLIQQKSENGIEKFMHKLGSGYANYFNKKYQRVGSLFQGRFKATMIEKDAHFLHIPNYIHCNPLKLMSPNWKTEGIDDADHAINFLEDYRWSSLSDYIGKKNFPSLTERTFLLDCFGGAENYKIQLANWVKEARA